MTEQISLDAAVEDLSLMLLYLNRFRDRERFCRYREMAWKNYDFNAMDRLEEKNYIIQGRKAAYLTEEGSQRARALLERYHLPDQGLWQRFEFREIRQEEAEQAADIEQICFPPNEACARDMMYQRVKKAPELFLVACDRRLGKLAGFLNGLSTGETSFRDEFFTNADLYDPEGKTVMLLGLDVLPQYRGQGLARELMYEYLRRQWCRGRKQILLTCVDEKVKMYRKFGFEDRGIANSTWGDEQWHEMSCIL